MFKPSGEYRSSNYNGWWEVGDYGCYISDYQKFVPLVEVPNDVAMLWVGATGQVLNKQFIVVNVSNDVFTVLYKHDDWWHLYQAKQGKE